LRKLNKKAQLSGGIQSILHMLSSFISTLPPLGKIAMFLLFLSIFSFVFSLLFGLLGYHCDAQNNLYKTGFTSIITNLQLIAEKPAPEEVSSITFPSRTENNPLVTSRCVIEHNNTYYFNGAYCTDCNYTKKVIDGFEMKLCVGDVYRIPDRNKSFLKKLLCQDDGGFGSCDIPVYYFFNSTIGRYQCLNTTYCGNITVGAYWTAKLKEKAQLVKQDATIKKSYSKAFTVTCKDLTPTFRFYGIPIFDYKLWLFMILLSALIVSLSKIKSIQ